jgi:hypothetical protein
MKMMALALFLMLLGCDSTTGPSAATTSEPAMRGDWRVEVATEGGIAGKGLGSVAIAPPTVSARDLARSCDGTLADDEQARLASAAGAAKPEGWKSEYVRPENPHGYADQIRYTLTLTRGQEKHATSWYEETRAQLPSDAASLYNEAWKARARVVASCK